MRLRVRVPSADHAIPARQFSHVVVKVDRLGEVEPPRQCVPRPEPWNELFAKWRLARMVKYFPVAREGTGNQPTSIRDSMKQSSNWFGRDIGVMRLLLRPSRFDCISAGW